VRGSFHQQVATCEVDPKLFVMGFVFGLIGLVASAQSSASPVALLILLGVAVIAFLIRVIFGFAMAAWGTRDAINNEGFAQRFRSYHMSRRRKKVRHRH
jgi:hypothetical protein